MKISKNDGEMPIEMEDKYFFLLGMVLGSIELNVFDQQSPYLSAMATFLESNQTSHTEIQLYQAIRELQNRPYEPPF